MTPPGLAADPILSHALAYWRRLAGDRAMPSRREIDPAGLGAKVLPYTLLIDVLPGDRLRLRFRLCGSAVADAAGLDLTGRQIDELNPNAEYARYLLGLYARMIAARRPIYSESRYLSARSRRATRRLLCPLSDDGSAVTHVLGVQTFLDVSGLDPPTMTYADDFWPGVEALL